MIGWPLAERAFVARRVLTFHEGRREECPRGVLLGAGRVLGFFDPDSATARQKLAAAPEDWGEAVVVPGFTDAHNHLPSAVLDSFAVRTAQVGSTAGLLECLAAAAASTTEGQWLVTEHALSSQQLDAGKIPSARILDGAVARHPVAVRLGAHVMALNSRALELSGISRLEHDPPGGIVERELDGRPTGVIREYGATQYVLRCVGTRLQEPSLPDAIRSTQADYARSGITTVRVTGLRPGELAQFQRVLSEDGFLRTRVFGGPRMDPTTSLEARLKMLSQWPAVTGFGNDWLGIDAVKIFVDHGVETVIGGQPPELLMAQEDLNRLVAEAVLLGWSVTCHAVTEPAVDAALAAFAEARRLNGRADLVIEHGFTMTDGQLSRLARSGIWWSTQPAVVALEMSPHTTALRGERLVPLRRALDLGVRCVLGSDWNAMPGSTERPFLPMKTVELCVERRSLWGESLGEDESLDPQTALFLHTRAAAELLGHQDAGGIWPGARADLVALSADPTEDLAATVDSTVVGARTVFAR